MKKSHLRWKMEPRETGLRSIGAGPRGSILHDGSGDSLVSVVPDGGGCRGPLIGWFWVCSQRDWLPYANTYKTPVATADEAKAAAMAYVKKHLAAKEHP